MSDFDQHFFLFKLSSNLLPVYFTYVIGKLCTGHTNHIAKGKLDKLFIYFLFLFKKNIVLNSMYKNTHNISLCLK